MPKHNLKANLAAPVILFLRRRFLFGNCSYRTISLAALLVFIFAAQGGAETPAPPTAVFDIRTSGAVGDGQTVNTKAIQSAIDQCSAAGGGTVLVSGGRYVTGTLYLKSNLCLHIDAGAALLGSTQISDYTTDTDRTMYRGEPYMNRCLLFAKDATNICIEGTGTIDGQGKSLPERGDPQKNRPKLIRFLSCSRLRMRDITLQSPASWTTEWRYCSDIAVDGITIFSRANSNGDGLDFDGCTKVRVSNSTFDTSDDSICLQTSLVDKPCLDVAINNCHFTSRWAGIRIGLLSRGNFENVIVSNCTFRDHNDSGLKIQMNEGGEMKNMAFSNLVMTNVPRPVFLTFCQKNAWVDSRRELPPMKSVSNLQFDNILVNNEIGNKNSAFIVTGMPDHPVENITFHNIRALFGGGGKEEDAKSVLAELTPENLATRWPEYGGLHGTVPAFGIYARHVKGLSISDVQLNTKNTDARPAVVLVDVADASTSNAPSPDVR
jgi:polygalacturonase